VTTSVTRVTGPTYVVLDTDHCVFFLTDDANVGLLTLTLAARPEQTLGEGASDPCVIGTTGLTLEKVGDNVPIVYDCLEQVAV
jgi:hypothetical protein